jgi:uncharacterized membrane protein YkoI
MPVSRRLIVTLVLGLSAVPAFTADAPHRACLAKAEQHAALAANRAIPLAQAIKSLREHGHPAELVQARLCHRGETLVYVLTLLARSGKVTRATVDAANGELIGGH